jgi:hypothetical protein
MIETAGGAGDHGSVTAATSAAFATPETNPLPPPPSSPTPARTIINSRAVISRAIDDSRWRVVARRSVDNWRLIALGVARWWPIGSRLPWSTSAEVSGDRIAVASVPRHLAPLAIATCDPDRASGRNGRDDFRVRSRSATQIDGSGDRGRPCASSTCRRLRGWGLRSWAILRLRVRYPFLLRCRRILLRTPRCHYCRSRNDAQRHAERFEMERHDNFSSPTNAPLLVSGQEMGCKPISVTNLRPKFRSPSVPGQMHLRQATAANGLFRQRPC